MKPYLAITIFLTLIIPAVATSWGSYKITEACIINDLNQALARTIQQKDVSIITPDTLSTYRRFLNNPALKSRVYLAHCPRIETGNAVCSDTMIGNPKLPALGIQLYAGHHIQHVRPAAAHDVTATEPRVGRIQPARMPSEQTRHNGHRTADL